MRLKHRKASYILFMPSMDVPDTFDLHTGYGWAPCSDEQNAYLRTVEHIPAAQFEQDPDSARLFLVFEIFYVEDVVKL